ncbi:hypothetical protein GYMLUDRAFT_57587 [Collybiopsis luxurians FD-317 M1]|uniref:Uncharacterized protein n=1 Tax=Collybiopsis luxurians FD-317 M1 TaxID=944289 RepID=A0A0D0D2C4_9AGAR|nr:hypothetical protein GYMLUDRAFT_57587 [Collybiopsis luxurians FD-317 M1]
MYRQCQALAQATVHTACMSSDKENTGEQPSSHVQAPEQCTDKCGFKPTLRQISSTTLTSRQVSNLGTAQDVQLPNAHHMPSPENGSIQMPHMHWTCMQNLPSNFEMNTLQKGIPNLNAHHHSQMQGAPAPSLGWHAAHSSIPICSPIPASQRQSPLQTQAFASCSPGPHASPSDMQVIAPNMQGKANTGPMVSATPGCIPLAGQQPVQPQATLSRQQLAQPQIASWLYLFFPLPVDASTGQMALGFLGYPFQAMYYPQNDGQQQQPTQSPSGSQPPLQLTLNFFYPPFPFMWPGMPFVQLLFPSLSTEDKRQKGKKVLTWEDPQDIIVISFDAPFQMRHGVNTAVATTSQECFKIFISLAYFATKYNDFAAHCIETSKDTIQLEESGAKLRICDHFIPVDEFDVGSKQAFGVAEMFSKLFDRISEKPDFDTLYEPYAQYIDEAYRQWWQHPESKICIDFFHNGVFSEIMHIHQAKAEAKAKKMAQKM